MKQRLIVLIILALVSPVVIMTASTGDTASASTNKAASDSFVALFSSGLVRAVSLGLYFNNDFYAYNNGDLRPLDNASADSVARTDDRVSVGLLEFGAVFRAKLALGIQFEVDLYRQAYWGNDSIEYTSPNPFLFRSIFFDIPVTGEGSSRSSLTLKVGRFPFELHPAKNHHNWVFRDRIDAAALRYHSGSWGIDIFGDVFSMNSPVDSIYELRMERHDYTVPFFDGDVNTFRVGILPWFNLLDETSRQASLRPFLFFSRIGAMGRDDGSLGGFEQSQAGATGNVADNDFLVLGGAAAHIQLGAFSAVAEVAWSYGKDRKLSPKPDVSINGILVHLSAGYRFAPWLELTVAGLYVSGAETDSEGHYINYGYTGFKAQKAGGFLFQQYYGVYPYAILDSAGLTMTPTEAFRRGPIAAGLLRLQVERLNLKTMQQGTSGINASLEVWFYADTSKNSTDYSVPVAPEANDLKRLGKVMGLEVDYSLSCLFSKGLLEAGIQGGLFFPGKFYTFPTINTLAPHGDAVFWGIHVFSKLRF